MRGGWGGADRGGGGREREGRGRVRENVRESERWIERKGMSKPSQLQRKRS